MQALTCALGPAFVVITVSAHTFGVVGPLGMLTIVIDFAIKALPAIFVLHPKLWVAGFVALNNRDSRLEVRA